MKHEELLKKWLKGTLSPEEEKAFNALEDSSDLERLAKAMPQFKVPDFDTDLAFTQIKEKINPSVASKTRSLYRDILPIAAILVLAIGIIFAFKFLNTSGPTSFTTEIAKQEILTLPDKSKVQLNAVTTLSYNEATWEKERIVQLDGEAYFKVAKGEKFTVQTKAGNVTVLGTEFNVQQRDNIFMVTCYEGSVKVSVAKEAIVLSPGNTATLSNNILIKQNENSATNPSWILGTSSFKSVPYQEVLHEFERQYNVTISHNLKNDMQLFTGNFNHQNLEKALQTITLPFQYKYTINKNTVTIYGE